MDAWNFTTNFGNRIFADKNFDIIVLIFDLILSGLQIANCLTCPYFIIRVSQTPLIHGNLKILLCYLPMGFLMVNMAQFVCKLSNTFVINKETATFWLFQQCFTGFYIISIISCAFSSLFIMIERSIAVFKRSTYEKRGNTLGIIFVVLNIIGSLILSLLAILSNALINENEPKHNINWNLIILANFLICGIISLVLRQSASRCNQKVVSYNEQNTLSDRFQSQENNATLRILTPILIFLICSTLFSLILIFVLSHIHQIGSLDQRIVDLTLTTICIFYMVRFLRKHDPLRKTVARDFCFCNSHKRRAIYATSYDCPSARALHDTFSHFDKLEEIWNRCK